MTLPARVRALLERAQAASLRRAAREQGLADLRDELSAVVPDVSRQYTTFAVDTPALVLKVRTQHAFQVRLALRAVERVLQARRPDDHDPLAVVDLGDSAGTHLAYIRAALSHDPRVGAACFAGVGVNLDAAAVARIRARGFAALHRRVEDLRKEDVPGGAVLLAFELLEHLSDPIALLDELSQRLRAGYLVVTVPYVARSRVGLHHIRQGRRQAVGPENTHVFELAPDDWRLLFQHAGWDVVESATYLQYPLRSPWRAMRAVWRRLDFEGFHGAILRPDRVWADCYQR